MAEPPGKSSEYLLVNFEKSPFEFLVNTFFVTQFPYLPHSMPINIRILSCTNSSGATCRPKQPTANERQAFGEVAVRHLFEHPGETYRDNAINPQ